MRPIISDPSLPQRNDLTRNLAATNVSLTRLATGMRINTGADDPAGLIASENLRAVLAALEAETRAVERADAVARTADGALGEISELTRRAESLAIANASSGGMSDAEREANQMEIDSILQSMDRIASTTEFNGQRLLDGTASISLGDETVGLDSMYAGDLGDLDAGGESYDLSDVGAEGPLNIVDGDVSIAVSVIREAGASVAAMRGRLGAFSSNSLATERNRLGIAIENITAAESMIRDADFAEETSLLTRRLLLSDSSMAAVASANAANTPMLSLLLG